MLLAGCDADAPKVVFVCQLGGNIWPELETDDGCDRCRGLDNNNAKDARDSRFE
jgi:hypothetical protein